MIKITPGSLAGQAYGGEEVMEQFYCNYGLNPEYRDKLDHGELKLTGVDIDGQARIVEIPDRRFYVATLFLPQISSRHGRPHPLIVAYLKAAMDFQTSRMD